MTETQKQGIAAMQPTAFAIHVGISKALSVPARGFSEAVADARKAEARDDVDGLFVAVTIASNWVAAISFQATALKNDADVIAVGLARDRALQVAPK